MTSNGTHAVVARASSRLTYAGEQAEFDGAGADVSADTIRALLHGKGLKPKTTKLTVRDATIVGGLDLEAAELVIAVKFRHCVFRDPINLEQAKATVLYFVDCRLHGIAASQLQTTFGFVAEKCIDTGGINLTGAHIRGQISFDGTKLCLPGGRAMVADGLIVDQDMRCSDGFEAKGAVRLVGAHIGGQLLSENSRFLNPGGHAVEASGIVVDQDVYWAEDFRVVGAVRLRGAHIKGELRCKNARFSNAGATALDLSGLAVDQDVSFARGTEVSGGIDLTGTHIGGQLNLTGGKFRHVGFTAVDLARACLSQNMSCQSGFEIQGKMLLAGATITGSLRCDGGKFSNPNGTAIDATGLTVGRDVEFCRNDNGEGFVANGGITLSDASIGGSLNCTGGQLNNPKACALSAKGLNVTRDAVFRVGFTTDGGVDLSDATIGGCLNCEGGKFGGRATALRCDRTQVKQSAKLTGGFHSESEVSLRNAQIAADLDITDAKLDGDNAAATILALGGATVGGTLRMRFDPPLVGTIDLARAKVGQLDDQKTTWPETVCLDGFVYGGLPTDGPDIAARLAWLARSPHYVPQLYLQLASVYLAAGSTKESTAVSIAGEDMRLASLTDRFSWFRRGFGRLLRITVQYGYRPLRILLWLFILELIGSLVFWWLHDIGALVPANSSAPAFNTVIYSLDLLVPVFSLGQRAFWVPDPGAVWFTSGFTVVGWILAACLAVGVGKIFKN